MNDLFHHLCHSFFALLILKSVKIDLSKKSFVKKTLKMIALAFIASTTFANV